MLKESNFKTVIGVSTYNVQHKETYKITTLRGVEKIHLLVKFQEHHNFTVTH